MVVYTRPVSDVDRGAGCGAVSSPSHSIHGDGVVSARLQVVDCGSGLSAGNRELLWISVASWSDQ